MWRPHEGAQTEFLSRGEYECLFGGAAGPGKTDCLVVDATRHVHNPRYRALLLRRTFPQLQEIIDRCHTHYPSLGGIYRATEHRWYFPSGGTINLGHMQHENDKYNYQGKEFHFIGFDEVTQFTKTQYLYLFSRVRTTIPDIQPMVRATTNPGGIGHVWCKERFIDVAAPGETYVDPESGLSRAFIPARYTDNPSLFENDPDYVKRLMSLPEIERKRLLEGIWDIFEGQAFPELSQRVHGAVPFDIPPDWEKFMCMDWGFAKPFSIAWYAIDFDGVLYRYREFYGCKEGEADTGLRMTPIDVAREVYRIEKERVRFRVADPACWSATPKRDGTVGPSIVEDMGKEGIHFVKADNNRILGKLQIHERFKIEEELNEEGEIIGEHPKVVVFNSCTHFWRTMLQLRLDTKNPEDVDCFVKGTKVKTPTGEIPVEDIKLGDLVSTPIGTKRVIKAGISGTSDTVIKVFLSNGKSLKGTANHCVYVFGKGLIQLQELREGDELVGIEDSNVGWIWKLGKLFITISGTAENVKAGITRQMAPLLNWGIRKSIGKFISTISEKFQQGVTSTTLITTPATTIPQTSLQCPSISMQNITGNCLTQSLLSEIGTKQNAGKTFSRIMREKCMKTHRPSGSRVQIVALLLKLNTMEKSIATIANNIRGTIEKYAPFAGPIFCKNKTAEKRHKHVRISAVGNYEKAKVYRLTVEDAHLYYANGCLVTNTDQEDHIYDEFRYACMTRPVIPKRINKIPPGTFQAERNRYIRAKQYAVRHGVSLSAAYMRVR